MVKNKFEKVVLVTLPSILKDNALGLKELYSLDEPSSKWRKNAPEL